MLGAPEKVAYNFKTLILMNLVRIIFVMTMTHAQSCGDCGKQIDFETFVDILDF